MRFTPAEVHVKQGDTVKFVVRNSGKVLHEMVLGTEEALRKHAELMKRHPGMEHDEPYMAHVKPGGQEELTWTFTRPGTFMYGCLVPGHWEAGMKGSIVVAAVGGMTAAEVRKVDRDANKITLKHGDIENLEMPAMTMVFAVKDPAMLDGLKPGDKVRFTAEKVGGAFTVTRIESTN
jgi:Cu/Ag efflux protein CusF